MAENEEDKKRENPSAVYAAASQGNSTLHNPDTESVSRSAQYHTGTQRTNSTTNNTTTSTVEGLSAELDAQRNRELAQSYSAQGVEEDPETGELRIKTGSETIGDLLGMRESAEEAARKARLKKTASGIYQSLATLSDIISGSVGGNVYKREKDTVITDADKEADEKQRALLAAEVASKEKDRQRIEKAAQQAAAINARYDALRNRVSINNGSSNGESSNESAVVGSGAQKGKSKTVSAYGSRSGSGSGSKENTMTFSIGRGERTSGGYSGYVNFTVDKAQGRSYADKAIAEMNRLYRNPRVGPVTKTKIKDCMASVGVDMDEAETLPKLNDEQVQALMNLGLAFGTNGLKNELQSLYHSSPEYAEAYARLVGSDRYKRAGAAERAKMVQRLDIEIEPFFDLGGDDRAYIASPPSPLPGTAGVSGGGFNPDAQRATSGSALYE